MSRSPQGRDRYRRLPALQQGSETSAGLVRVPATCSGALLATVVGRLQASRRRRGDLFSCAFQHTRRDELHRDGVSVGGPETRGARRPGRVVRAARDRSFTRIRLGGERRGEGCGSSVTGRVYRAGSAGARSRTHHGGASGRLARSPASHRTARGTQGWAKAGRDYQHWGGGASTGASNLVPPRCRSPWIALKPGYYGHIGRRRGRQQEQGQIVSRGRGRGSRIRPPHAGDPAPAAWRWHQPRADGGSLQKRRNRRSLNPRQLDLVQHAKGSTPAPLRQAEQIGTGSSGRLTFQQVALGVAALRHDEGSA